MRFSGRENRSVEILGRILKGDVQLELTVRGGRH